MTRHLYIWMHTKFDRTGSCPAGISIFPVESGCPHTQFPRNRRRLDGRDNRCKRCTARMVSERLKQKEPITEPTGEGSFCFTAVDPDQDWVMVVDSYSAWGLLQFSSEIIHACTPVFYRSLYVLKRI